MTPFKTTIRPTSFHILFDVEIDHIVDILRTYVDEKDISLDVLAGEKKRHVYSCVRIPSLCICTYVPVKIHGN